MTEFIIAAVLWAVIGLVVTGIIWAVTVSLTGITAVNATAGEGPKWLPATILPVGIILTILALVLVVINVVTNIVNAFNAGG